MNDVGASWVVTGGIAGLSVLMLAAWPVLAWRAVEPPRRRAQVGRLVAGLAAWAVGWAALAASGVLAQIDRRPPPFALLPPLLVAGAVVVLRSPLGAALARGTPTWLLIGLQGFRLPLELVMHQAAKEGVMPPQMTFGVMGESPGLNYDVVTGALAVLLGLAFFRREVPRAVALGWNLLGLVLLVNVMAVGVASTPLFARFGTDAAHLNTWVLHAPFVWLPAVLVGSALLGHLLVFRKLLGGALAPAPLETSG